MTDSFQDIRVFAQIAKSGSFTAAGRELALNPSTVSKCVSRLEKKFGVRLFNRTTHSVRLSEEGKMLLEKALIVIDAMSDADSLKEGFSSTPSGRLRVYALPAFALFQLAPVLPEFLTAYPGMEIDVQLGTENIDSISTDIDVVFRFGQIRDSSLISRKLADSRWVVCAAPSYLERFGYPENPGELSRHNCLGFSLETFRQPWMFRTISGELPIKGSAKSNHAPMLRELALRGVGIIRVADFVVSNDMRDGNLVPLLTDFASEATEPLYALYQPQPKQAQRIRVFIDFLYRKFSHQTWI
ncbi:LysR family transcriptional regulator [Corticibacterium sp. UT-5YL-CI-8]|nr:LysR family transcriptional regulator [Tianweitania sp. UT-5YL-CI-8]